MFENAMYKEYVCRSKNIVIKLCLEIIIFVGSSGDPNQITFPGATYREMKADSSL